MVRIEAAPPGWEPPEDQKFALVEVAGSSTAYFSDLVKADESNLFPSNNDAPDIANAIDDACKWAEEHDAPVVYVARLRPDSEETTQPAIAAL